MTDFTLRDHGSLAVLTPVSAEACDWAAAHLPDDAMGWAGGTVIEPRYVPDIVEGILCDGLTVDCE